MTNQWQPAHPQGYLTDYDQRTIALWERHPHVAGYWCMIRTHARFYAKQLCQNDPMLAIFPLDFNPNTPA